MEEELKRIISEINLHTKWSKNAKIRYAYIELGKLVSKDAMFFYTIQNNLLSQEKADIRYSKEEVERLMTESNIFDYKVVCKNAAEMLAYILSSCGIECEIRKTLVHATYKSVVIPHYFVVATGDEEKKYFLTLNPDLPNIKIGKKTSKFAYEIKYYIDNDYMDGNNQGKQYYEGDEVDFSVLSDEELKKLDEEIGYVPNIMIDDNGTERHEYTDLFFAMIEEAYKKNSYYIDYVAHQTYFYGIISRMLNENKTLEEVKKQKPNLNDRNNSLNFKIGDIKGETWEDVKKYVFDSVFSKIKEKYKVLFDVQFDDLLKDRKYDEIKKTINSELYQNTDKEEIKTLGKLNPFFIVKQLFELFKIIDTFSENKELNNEEMNALKKKFGKCLSDISVMFVSKKLLPIGNSLSSTYLVHKLIYAFNSIFGIGYKSDFNDIGLAEQVVIIKELLEIILSDIKKDENIPDYNDQKSPLRNRIISTVLFDKVTKNPYYLIYVKNTRYGDNSNIMIVYDLIANELYTDKSPIDIISDYYVIKDADMRLIIEEFKTEKKDEEYFSI